MFQNAKTTKETSSRDLILEKISRNQVKEDDVVSLFLLGNAFFFDENYADSEKLFAKVFELQPSLVTGMKLARCQVQGQNFSGAELTLKRVALLFPQSAEPYLALAAIAAQNGDSKKLSEILNDAYKKHRHDEDIVLRYSEYLLATGKKERSQQVLKEYLKAHPLSSLTMLRLAKLKADEKKYSESKFLLEKVVHIQPGLADAWAILGFIYDAENNLKSSVKCLKQAHLKQPENDLYAKTYANQLIRTGDLLEAKRVLLKLESQDEKLKDDDVEIVFQLGLVFFQLEEFKSARLRFERIESLMKDPLAVRFLIAQCYEFSGQPDVALKLYLAIPPDSAHGQKALQRVTLVHLAHGRFDQAEVTLKKVTEQKPTEESDYKFLAIANQSLKHYSASLKAAEEGLRHFPQSTDLAYLRIIPLEFLFSQAKVKEELTAFLRGHPKYPDALNHLGYLLADSNERLDEALRYVQLAVQIEPKNGHYMDSLGWVLFKLHRYVEAEARLQQASTLDPEEPVVWEHLGEVYLARKMMLQALKSFEKARAVLATKEPWKVEHDPEWKAAGHRIQNRLKHLQEKTLGPLPLNPPVPSDAQAPASES